MKKLLPKLTITLIIISTFLWSQSIWASGIPQANPSETQKNFSSTVQVTSSKNFSKIRTAINLDPLISALDLLKNSLQNSLLSGWNNGLDQVTGYVDTVTKPNGDKEVIEMSGITYWADGRMKGYTQTTTGPDEKGKQETHTISIYNTEYDSLGRISSKYGRYDNKPYSWSAISYDELGRPTAYKERLGKARIKHYDIRYNELGDVVYEKVKTTVKSAFSKSESLNEYWYGYDSHGQLEKIKENEIYSKSSRTFLGKLVDAILYGPLAFLPDKIFLEYIKPAIQAVVGFLNPALVPLMIALDTVRNIMFGMDIGDALKGAAIQLLTWAITAGLSGGAPPIETLVGQELAKAIITKAVQTIATRLVYDLLEDKLGTFGAALVSALVGNLITTISPIPGYDTGFLTSEGVFDWLGILQTTAQAGIKALIAEIAKRNPDLAWALPLIETLLNTFISQAIQEARESIKEQKIKELQAKGYNVILDQNKNVIGLTRIDQENGIIYYYTPDEKLQYSDQIVQKDGQEYILRTYGLAYSEVYIRDTTTGSLNLLFKGEGWFNSIDTYQNKDGTTLQFLSLTAPDGTTTYFELDGRPVFTAFPDGKILSYDYNGNPEGWLVKDALPRWNQGQFAGSYIEDDLGTTYFDRNGGYAGFTPEGYTAVQVDDQIAYSYQKISDNSFYMVDSDGKNNRYIRQQLDGMNIPIGEYIADNTTTAYHDSRGIKLWDRENIPNSIINLYLEDGSPWAQITTLVSQSGLTEGYRFTDFATDDFRQYNSNGELQGYYLARKDAEGNIYGYKGVDTQGTQITLDRDGNIHSTLTKKGEYSVYKNGELYRVLRRESVAILAQGILDQDPITGKFTLYDDIGTKITDNPVLIVAKLNFSLLTLSPDIRDKIWNDAKDFLQAVMDKTDFSTIYETVPERVGIIKRTWRASVDKVQDLWDDFWNDEWRYKWGNAITDGQWKELGQWYWQNTKQSFVPMLHGVILSMATGTNLKTPGMFPPGFFKPANKVGLDVYGEGFVMKNYTGPTQPAAETNLGFWYKTLPKMGWPKLPVEEFKNFLDTPVPVEFEPGTKLYRITVPGGENRPYWTLEKPSSIEAFREGWAVPPEWNPATHILEYTVPKGQIVRGWMGATAPKDLNSITYPGGKIQVYIEPRWFGGDIYSEPIIQDDSYDF